jgi:hypothetical protein
MTTSYTISCYTLFDITNHKISGRHKPVDMDLSLWQYKRNTQSNFDTILQIISLRSQPENISDVELVKIKFNETSKFGYMFNQNDEEEHNCWKFTFTITNSNVFSQDNNELKLLYQDCHNVPMIMCSTQFNQVLNFLDTTDELRNIYFEVLNDEQ